MAEAATALQESLETEEQTMVESIVTAHDQELARNDRVMVLGEDVGEDGGIFRCTDGLLDKYGPDRVVDTPLAETGIVGVSIGLAVNGMVPVPELQFSGFSYQSFHQIESHAARLRKRTQGEFNVPMTIRMPYGAGVRALEHHSESRETYWNHTPGLKTVIPRGPYQTWAYLKAAIRDPDPVVFLEPKALYRKFREPVPQEDVDADELPDIGPAEVLKQGDDVTVVAFGHMLYRTRQAVQELENEQGLSATVINLPTVSPLDSETIIDSVEETGRCVVVQEAHRTLGIASEISARIMDEAVLHLQAPVKRVTAPDVITPLLAREQCYMPDVPRIKEGIVETVRF
jgi:pyruvate dehydrogenase E1 component beta subunit